MRTGNLRFVALVGAAALAAAFGVAMATEGDGNAEAAVAVGDDVLVERLLALEPSVPAPLPSAATLAAGDVDAVFTGSFTSARAGFDAIENDLRSLFVDGDSAGTEVGDAVAAVARGLLVEHQALMVLEVSDGSTDPRPIDESDAVDADGTAIDADGLYGTQITGLQLLIDARTAQRTGYAVLATLPTGLDDGNVFAARVDALTGYDQTVGVALRVAVSSASEQMLLGVVRYEAPLGIAQATGVEYVCVNREAYLALTEASEADRLAGSVAEPDAECAAAAQRAGLDLSAQVASDPDMVDVETADTSS